MNCPRCRKKATLEHFRTSPECDRHVQSLCALRSASKRTKVTRAGGRPRKGSVQQVDVAEFLAIKGGITKITEETK